MKLRTKVFIYTFLALLVSGTIYTIAFFLWIQPGFNAYESNFLSARSKQLFSIIDNEINHLSVFTRDWAYWDDSYTFVTTHSTDFIDSNLGMSTFIEGHIHGMIFLDDISHIVWSKRFNAEYNASLPVDTLPNELLQHVDSIRQGISALDGQPFFFVQTPILKSDKSGPSSGTLVIIRYIDNILVEKLSKQLGTKLQINLEPASNQTTISNGPDHHVNIIDDYQLHLINYYPTVTGGALRIVSSYPRDMHQHGVYIIQQITIIVLAVFIIAMILLTITLNRTVTRPLSQLTQQLEQVNDFTDLKDDSKSFDRIFLFEIRILVNAFQQMASRIISLSEQLQESNKKLNMLAVTDPLTDIPNRRYFFEEGERMVKHVRRQHQPFSVILIDVDYFKDYNDTYGHQEGDQVLKEVAQTIKQMLKRPLDLCARYGGEEFVAVVTECTPENAVALTESLRSAIESLDIRHEKSVYQTLTASLGLFTVLEDATTISLDNAIKKADENLYQAKKGGRNRVVASTSGLHATDDADHQPTSS